MIALMTAHPRQGPDVGIPAWPWAFVGLVTLPLAALGIVIWYGTYGAVGFGDVDWYAASLPALFSDAPLYEPLNLEPHVLHRPAYWNQPPATALLSLVLVLPGGAWVWGTLMAAGVVLGVVLMWPRVGLGGVVLLAPVLLLWRPVVEALVWANVNGLVFGLLAVAWRYPRAAGWAIGIASIIKLIPLMAVLWLVGKRDWRGAAIATGLFVAATLVIVIWKGPATISDFVIVRLNEVVPADAGPGVGFSEAFGLAPVWGYVAAGALLVLALRFASLSVAIVAMLVSVPSLHLHYLTWLLVPLLGAWLPWVVAKVNERAELVHSPLPQTVRPAL